jgi:hypothetical protein
MCALTYWNKNLNYKRALTDFSKTVRSESWVITFEEIDRDLQSSLLNRRKQST